MLVPASTLLDGLPFTLLLARAAGLVVEGLGLLHPARDAAFAAAYLKLCAMRVEPAVEEPRKAASILGKK